jgi:3'-5' exoribonuclease
MKQYIAELRVGSPVDSLFAVKYKRGAPRRYSKGWMFELLVTDASGEAPLKYWGENCTEDDILALYESFDVRDVVRVIGVAQEYKGVLELSVSRDEGGVLAKTDEYALDDFLPKTEKDVETMLAELQEFIGRVENNYLNALLTSVFGSGHVLEKFKSTPASINHHQNWLGGLLEHTLNVARLCAQTANVHRELNKDLLLTGALLHDIGKVFEYTMGTVFGRSDEGILRGHIVLGEEYVRNKIKEQLDFPAELRLKLLHMILSHHGKREFGTPCEPMLPEAVALYFADHLDAQVAEYVKAKGSAKHANENWHYEKGLGLAVYLK